MDNVEFVKAYEQWKNSEARDTSPERFAEWLGLRQMSARLEYMTNLPYDKMISSNVYYAIEIMSGEHDSLMEHLAYEDIKEAEND